MEATSQFFNLGNFHQSWSHEYSRRFGKYLRCIPDDTDDTSQLLCPSVTWKLGYRGEDYFSPEGLYWLELVYRVNLSSNSGPTPSHTWHFCLKYIEITKVILRKIWPKCTTLIVPWHSLRNYGSIKFLYSWVCHQVLIIVLFQKSVTTGII